MTIRVLVADDQDIVRAGLCMLLDAQPGITVVGEAADGRRAIAIARSLRPDVCLLDIRMTDVDGIEATRQLVYGPLKAGVRRFLLKDAGAELISQAVHAAARGDALIAPNITARLLSCFADSRSRPRPPEPVESLTAREEQVLLTIARGHGRAPSASGDSSAGWARRPAGRRGEEGHRAEGHRGLGRLV